MVSNASEDLPDPETPLTTVSLPWGISQEMLFRLCVRAPRITIASFEGLKGKTPDRNLAAGSQSPQPSTEHMPPELIIGRRHTLSPHIGNDEAARRTARANCPRQSGTHRLCVRVLSLRRDASSGRNRAHFCSVPGKTHEFLQDAKQQAPRRAMPRRQNRQGESHHPLHRDSVHTLSSSRQ